MSNQVISAKAVARTVRIAPRKVRLVLDLIRGKKVGEAIAILKFTPKAGAPIVEKVLMSAIANTDSAVSKISLIPGWFGINELVTFGMPIMFNPILCIRRQ